MSKIQKKKTNGSDILDFIRDKSYRPMRVRELARSVHISEDEYPAFRRQIKKLLDDGDLVMLKRNRIGLPDAMGLMTGVISITKAGPGYCQCDNRDEEVFISPHHLLTAFNGDRVLVRLLPEVNHRGKCSGEVIKILERRLSEIVGTFQHGRSNDYLVPDTRSVNRNINILRGRTKGAQSGEKVVIKLAGWDNPYLNPDGEVIERLGYPDDPGVDMLAIIRKYQLPEDFPGDVEEEAGRVVEGWEEEIVRRPDLTGLTTFTIDPVDARDHDDAVSIKRLDGGWRLGVHIADVSHFVRPQTNLDREAIKRGTSVYFPDRVIPMLPEELSNDVCSLKPNRRRLTYSIFIDFDSHGRVRNYELTLGVIKSRAKLSYEEVQDFFDGKSVSDRFEQLADDLAEMRRLAAVLLERRREAGSLDFDLPEAKIILDEHGNVIEIGNRVRRESHRVVEEFMLAANRQVAYHFVHLAQPTLYRVHDRPNLEKLEAFSYLLSKLGYRFPVSATMPAKDFSRLLETAKGKPEEELVNELLLRSMAKAVYQPGNIGHFGLAFNHYLHFTSPIRRYPDLLVHRLLKMLHGGRYPAKFSQKIGPMLVTAGKQSSEMERRAMEAERDAVRAKQVAYMAGQVGSEYDGIISGVVTFGFFVRLIGPECDGLIRASALDDDYYRFDEANYQMVGARKGRIFRLGDKVRVGVMRVNKEAREIDLFLVASARDTEKVAGKKPKAQKKRRK